jgi:hypothetical protein
LATLEPREVHELKQDQLAYGISRQMRGLEGIEKIILFRLQNPSGGIEVLLIEEPELMKQLECASKR